jgi:hypothetical protein
MLKMNKTAIFFLLLLPLAAWTAQTLTYLTYLADSAGNITDARKIAVKDSTGLDYQALLDSADRYMVHGYDIYLQSYYSQFAFCRAQPADPGNFAGFTGTAEPRILFNFKDDAMSGPGFHQMDLFGDSISLCPSADTVSCQFILFPVRPYAAGYVPADAALLRKNILCDSQVVSLKDAPLQMWLYKFTDSRLFVEPVTWYLVIFTAAISDTNAPVSPIPFPSSSACWSFECQPSGCPPGSCISYSTFFLNGDTIINNTAYSKMYLKGDSRLEGIIREDSTKKIYYKRAALDPCERLIFDFNVNIGDSVKIPFPYIDSSNIEYAIFVISNIDTIFYSGINRRRYDVYVYDRHTDYWLEGVGSALGGPDPFAWNYTGGGCQLIGFDEKGLNCCDTSNSIAKSPGTAAKTDIIGSVSPNPFNPSTRISCNLGQGRTGALQIFDIRGKLVFSRPIQGSGTVIWDAAGQGSGVYVLKVLSTGKIRSRKLILQR